MGPGKPEGIGEMAKPSLSCSPSPGSRTAPLRCHPSTGTQWRAPEQTQGSALTVNTVRGGSWYFPLYFLQSWPLCLEKDPSMDTVWRGRGPPSERTPSLGRRTRRGARGDREWGRHSEEESGGSPPILRMKGHGGARGGQSETRSSG